MSVIFSLQSPNFSLSTSDAFAIRATAPAYPCLLQIEPELCLAERCQVLGRRAADEIDFKMVGREIRRALAFEETRQLTLQVSVVFRACRRRSDVHHIAVTRALMLVF